MNAIGPYRIICKLGEGGMGVVYRAEDTMLNRDVALKLIHQHLVNDENLSSRFLSEARVTASLLHGNIATLYNLVEHDGQLAMVMEFIEGITLEDLLRKMKPLGEGLASGILLQVLNGLEVAHERGIVHRDIKPSNIMITKSGQVKIMDFGIAQRQGASRLTQTGKMVGTLHYMAPEQILGQEAVCQSDLYAAGIVLYEMLAGNPPFAGKSDFTLMEAQIKMTPPLQVPALRSKVSRILQQALRKKADQRFQTAAEFKAALQSVAVPYDAAHIRSAVFETAQITGNQTPQVIIDHTQEGPPGQAEKTIVGKLNRLPSWLPKVIFGSAAALLLVVFAFLFLQDNTASDVTSESGDSELSNSERTHAGATLSLGTSDQVSTEPNTDLIETYLMKARQLHRDKKHLPPGENAVYYCNEILRMVPSHSEALSIKHDISQGYEDAGDNASKRSNFDLAIVQYQYALASYSPNSEITRKIEDLQRRKTTIASSSKPAVTAVKTSTPSQSRNERAGHEAKGGSNTTPGKEEPIDKEVNEPVTPVSSSPPGISEKTEEVKSKTTEPASTQINLKSVQIPKNTKLIVQLVQAVNSENMSQGQRVKFTCPLGLTVNGIHVIEQGAEASGTLSDVRPSEGQRSGRIEISMDATRSVNGELIPLYGVFMDIAKSKTPIEFSQGTRFEVSVRNLINVNGY